ncbi:hypothetical protein CC78DRAFT_569595 [Lojkania enalia]|uniref:Hydrophobin n=1 Tax=Lojkania enalia TaxID=147567 RepID=A0A9P4K607_9PLEO|nr:hypothetical protein CC78DRAFT_569595 [Didymosphaeria enalia]
MQFSILLSSILSLASAAAISERSPTKVSGRDAGRLVQRDGPCSELYAPLCCQLDVSGVANLNCESVRDQASHKSLFYQIGDVETTEEFEAICAETGLTAECCVLAVGSDGLVCTAA